MNTFKKTTVAALVAALSLGTASLAFADEHEHHEDHDRWGNTVDMHRGYGPEHKFYIGKTLPREYHRSDYVVEDWRGNHLRQPPRGYHWVRQGDDFLLVAVTTGLIASAIVNAH